MISASLILFQTYRSRPRLFWTLFPGTDQMLLTRCFLVPGIHLRKKPRPPSKPPPPPGTLQQQELLIVQQFWLRSLWLHDRVLWIPERAPPLSHRQFLNAVDAFHRLHSHDNLRTVIIQILQIRKPKFQEISPVTKTTQLGRHKSTLTCRSVSPQISDSGAEGITILCVAYMPRSHSRGCAPWKEGGRALVSAQLPGDREWWEQLQVTLNNTGEKLAYNSTFKTLRSWRPVPLLHSK